MQPIRRARKYEPKPLQYKKPYIPLGHVELERAPGEPSQEMRMFNALIKALQRRRTNMEHYNTTEHYDGGLGW